MARNLGRPFFWTKCLSEKTLHFFWKNRACLPSQKKIRSLIKPWLKNSFYTNFQGTGPWEGPIHFSMFFSGFIIYNNCSNFFQSWSWSQEKKGRPLPKAIAEFKAQAFPQRIRPLIKPWLMNIFYTNFQGTGPWEGPIHLVGLFSGCTIAVHFSRADPGAERRKVGLFQKQLPNSKPKPFPKEPDRLLNPSY